MFLVRLTLSKAIFLTCFTLREKCPDSELFWFEWEMRTRISPNTYQNKSEYVHFLRNVRFWVSCIKSHFLRKPDKMKKFGKWYPRILLIFGYFVQMDKKSYCQFSFEKNLAVAEIRGLEIWPSSSQNYFLKQESIFWFNLRLD